MSVSTNNKCLEIQQGFDHGLFIHTKLAVHLTSDLLQVDPKTIKWHQTFVPRMLIVIQSISCLAILPFKMLFAIFSGCDALSNTKDRHAWVNTLYALGSVGACAMAVPAGIILAFTPWSTVQKIQQFAQFCLNIARTNFPWMRPYIPGM